MISSVKIPEKVVLAGNEVVAAFSSQENVITQGGPSRFRFKVNFSFNFHLTLSWNSNSLHFTVPPWGMLPDNSGLQFSHPEPLMTETLSHWVSRSVGPTLQSNYILARDFIITYSGQFIDFVARNTGSIYDISLTSGYSIPTWLTAGTDRVVRDLFYINLEVHIVQNGAWVKVGEDLLNVGSSSMAVTDIHSYLNPYVSSGFTWPELPLNNIYKRPEHTRKFKIRACERWIENNQPVYRKVKEFGDMIALYGGLSKMLLARLLEKNTNFWNNYQSLKYFLTWQPRDKTIAYDQVEKLYLLIVSNPHTVKLMVRYNYSGSQDGSDTLTRSLSGITQYSVCEFIITPSKLGITPPAGCTLDSFEFWIEDTFGAHLSETRYYTIDYSYFEFSRMILFQNSLGGFDTLRCTGEQIIENEYIIEDVLSVEGFYKYTRKPEKVNYLTSEDQTFKTNTGWLNIEETEWLRELFLSKERYEIRDGILYPIMFKSATVMIRRDNDYLYNYTIEYQHGFTDQFYSNEKLNIQNVISGNLSEIAEVIQSGSIPVAKFENNQYK